MVVIGSMAATVDGVSQAKIHNCIETHFSLKKGISTEKDWVG
jgi:hypothetical protein